MNTFRVSFQVSYAVIPQVYELGDDPEQEMYRRVVLLNSEVDVRISFQEEIDLFRTPRSRNKSNLERRLFVAITKVDQRVVLLEEQPCRLLKYREIIGSVGHRNMSGGVVEVS